MLSIRLSFLFSKLDETFVVSQPLAADPVSYSTNKQGGEQKEGKEEKGVAYLAEPQENFCGGSPPTGHPKTLPFSSMQLHLKKGISRIVSA